MKAMENFNVDWIHMISQPKNKKVLFGELPLQLSKTSRNLKAIPTVSPTSIFFYHRLVQICLNNGDALPPLSWSSKPYSLQEKSRVYLNQWDWPPCVYLNNNVQYICDRS